MSDKKIDDALEYGIASNAIEGLYISPEVRKIIKEAMKSGKSDKSFLYELIKELEQSKSDISRGENNGKVRK